MARENENSHFFNQAVISWDLSPDVRRKRLAVMLNGASGISVFL
jgi:hypothetical protein